MCERGGEEENQAKWTDVFLNLLVRNTYARCEKSLTFKNVKDIKQ